MMSVTMMTSLLYCLTESVILLALWYALAQWKKADSVRARIAQEKRKVTRNG